MPPINLLIKPASGLCNMKCDYCFYCDETKKREQETYGFMDDRTLKNVIRKSILYAQGACTIAFQGGEPTLCGLDFYKKVTAYVEQYNKNHIRIQYALQTNGYDITQEWCDFFVKNNFLIGISIDGPGDIHDRYRHNSSGNGSYERVMETVRLFDRYHVEYNILTVVHKQTAKRITEIYHLYKKMGFGYLQFINCLDPLYEPRGQQEYSLLPEDYGNFMIQLFALWYQDFKKGEQPYIRHIDNYISMLCGYLPESCDQRGVCGIQNVVEADGSVYPCDFYVLDSYRLGNLNTDSMQKIQEEREWLGFIRHSYNHSDNCMNCKWHKICRGGCFRNRDGETDNYFCEGYKMFFEACYDRMKEIAEHTEQKG